MLGFTDRQWFALAVICYGVGAAYSVLLWRRGFRRDDWTLYALLSTGAILHTVAMLQRCGSVDRCPIKKRCEATIFFE